MPRISLIDENSQDPLIKDVFDEIKEKAGRVPAAYRAFANHIHILKANWNRTKNILGQGNLPIETKEAIAVRVSTVNGCHFCVDIHRQNLQKLGVNEQEIEKNIQGSSSDEKLAYLLKVASIATKEPASLTDNDFSKLREYGLNDQDILELLTVMEMYTGYNKIIVALGLQPED